MPDAAARRTPSRILGVLGGMGPAATVDFYDRLVRATPAHDDQEHVRVVIWADPTVPNRHAALAGHGEDPGPWLRTGLVNLVNCGAEIVVSPCNTVHAFLPAALGGLPVRFLSIIDVTVDGVRQAVAPGSRVGVLAADGAVQSGLYQDGLREAGFEPLLPDEAGQRALMALVYRVKAAPIGADEQKRLGTLIQSLAAAGAAAVVVGCTELSVLLPDTATPIPAFDASQLLAERAVAAAFEPA